MSFINRIHLFQTARKNEQFEEIKKTMEDIKHNQEQILNILDTTYSDCASYTRVPNCTLSTDYPEYIKQRMTMDKPYITIC